MDNVRKFFVGIVLIAMITAIFFALDMMDLIISFFLLSLVVLVAVQLINESTYETIRGAWARIVAGLKEGVKTSLEE